MATNWKFYLNSRDAWDAMYEDCAKARQSMYIEQYIINDEPAFARPEPARTPIPRAGDVPARQPPLVRTRVDGPAPVVNVKGGGFNIGY